MPKESDQFLRALARGLSVIESFEGGAPAYRLSEIAARSNMSRATTSRILNTLRRLGYVATDGQRFSLKPKLLSLGHAYLSSFALPDVMLPYMKRLVGDEPHISSSSAVLDGTDIVFVAGVPAKGLLRVFMSVGMRVPAFASAMGRMLLASLPPERATDLLKMSKIQPLTKHTVVDPRKLGEIVAAARKRGFAVADQELGLGMRSLAVPILDRNGEAIAAISATHHGMDMSMRTFIKRYLSRMQQTAAEISQSVSSLQLIRDQV